MCFLVIASGYSNVTGGYAVDFDGYAFFDGSDLPTEEEVFSAMSNEELFRPLISDYVLNTKDIFNMTSTVSFGEREP